mmetsp:Transcript_6219/g.9125  ORF Transcript_6219/g.9125 Transcript_6219/m.9125 type:complete len:972 (-) Transcript_6219:2620-5535(-)
MQANPQIPPSYITPPHRLHHPNPPHKRRGKAPSASEISRRRGITAASAAGTFNAPRKPPPSLSSSQNKPAPPTSNSIILCRIRTPNPNDVLCGRGGGINSHPGNRTFRSWVRERKESYNLAKSKAQKAKLSREIVDRVRNLNPPGRFLMREDRTAGAGAPAPSESIGVSGLYYGWWIEIDDTKAMAKTSQALREGAPSIRAAHKTSPAATKAAAAASSKKSPPQEEQTEVGSVMSSPTVIDQQLSDLSAAKAKAEDTSASTTNTNSIEQNTSMEPSLSTDQSQQQQQQQQVGATVYAPDKTASGGSAASGFTHRPLAQPPLPQPTTTTTVSAVANAVTDSANRPLSPASLQHTASMIVAATAAAAQSAPSAPHYPHTLKIPATPSLQGITPSSASTVKSLAITENEAAKNRTGERNPPPFGKTETGIGVGRPPSLISHPPSSILPRMPTATTATTKAQPIFPSQLAPVAAPAPVPQREHPHQTRKRSTSAVPPPPPLFSNPNTHQNSSIIHSQPPSSTNTNAAGHGGVTNIGNKKQKIVSQPTKQRTQEASITPPPAPSQDQSSSYLLTPFQSAMLSMASTPPPGSSSNYPLLSPALTSITPGGTMGVTERERDERSDERSDETNNTSATTPTLMSIPLSPTTLNMTPSSVVDKIVCSNFGMAAHDPATNPDSHYTHRLSNSGIVGHSSSTSHAPTPHASNRGGGSSLMYNSGISCSPLPPSPSVNNPAFHVMFPKRNAATSSTTINNGTAKNGGDVQSGEGELTSRAANIETSAHNAPNSLYDGRDVQDVDDFHDPFTNEDDLLKDFSFGLTPPGRGGTGTSLFSTQEKITSTEEQVSTNALQKQTEGEKKNANGQEEAVVQSEGITLQGKNKGNAIPNTALPPPPPLTATTNNNHHSHKMIDTRTTSSGSTSTSKMGNTSSRNNLQNMSTRSVSTPSSSLTSTLKPQNPSPLTLSLLQGLKKTGKSEQS